MTIRSESAWSVAWRGGLIFMAALLLTSSQSSQAQGQAPATAAPRSTVREHLLMDFGWRFALGHAYDPQKDFNYTTVPFFFAKAGYGNGPASPRFDDRGWRSVNLPHDWAVELPFDKGGDANHGSKAIGRNFPGNSVGWYRKTFTVPASDLGRRISIDFDGVYRNSVVWINGHYLGTEPSGYSSFSYDVTDYLNYGDKNGGDKNGGDTNGGERNGTNVVAVRADATIEEGWFYEGAGIYRHAWLTKTAPIHIAHDGTFVTTVVNGNGAAPAGSKTSAPANVQTTAQVTVQTTVANDAATDKTFSIEQTIVNAEGKLIATSAAQQQTLKAAEHGEYSSILRVANPALWSIESPTLHKLVTTIRSDGVVVDRYETSFGIRTIHFDPDQGFFLNGKHVEIKGTDDHQDHAGVGVAVPDSLNEYRVARLKAFGSNAIRTSHNPPTPELLDACDRLGMLVLDEHRMMGTTPEILDQLKRLVVRDRNHPSVILWSVGNEEWTLEGTVTGERITAAMQAFVKRLDPTRPSTVALSSSGRGSSLATEVFGFNYYRQHHIDEMHARFPDRPMVGTEESSSPHTRGVYIEDREHQHLTAYDHNKDKQHSSIEEAWNFHRSRPFSSGLFYWTGFDYRGEPSPFDWPAISSQFGLIDTCGFFKDSAYLLQSWWTEKPMVHLLPDWNSWKEGEDVNVRAYSNAGEVELLLNGVSLGRKAMPPNSHLERTVKYAPGTLLARGFTDGKEVASDKVETTTAPAAIVLATDRAEIKADGEAVSLVTVRVRDGKGRVVPTAGSEIAFTLQGPGKIVGVGNGDPSSHQPDQFVETVSTARIVEWHRLDVDGAGDRPEVAANYDDSAWERAVDPRWDAPPPKEPGPAATVYRGAFTLPPLSKGAELKLIFASLGQQQSIYLNGKPLSQSQVFNSAGYMVNLDGATLQPGRNVVAVVATSMAHGRRRSFRWDDTGPGLIRIAAPADQWRRSLFNGLAQVIVESTGQPGDIRLTATSQGLSSAELRIRSSATSARPAVPAE